MNNDYKKCCFFNDTHDKPQCNALNKLYCMIQPDKKCAFFQTKKERAERNRQYGKPPKAGEWN